jgi:hypothetical protein
MLTDPAMLAFHKLSPKFSYGSTNVSPRRFEALLQYLDKWGYPPGSQDSSGPGIVISFDDGYQHLSEYLLSMMNSWQFVPLVFMPTALIGKSNNWDYSHFVRPERHLDVADIRMLSDKGVVFGSHGHSHSDLTSLSDDDLAMELRRSREILEDVTGKAVLHISYPFGRSDAKVAAAARDAGYKHGYTMDFPEPEDSPLLRGRVAVYGYDTPFSVRYKLASGGLLHQIEHQKARVTNRLSSGTVLLNKIRGYSLDRS